MSITEQQLFGLALMILAGIAAAFLFDVYRLARALFGFHGWIQDAGDLLFWILISPLVLVSVLLASWGNLRFFILLGFAAGAAVYFLLASPLVMRAGLRLVRRLRAAAAFLAGRVRHIAGAASRASGRIRRAAARARRWMGRFRRLPPPFR